MFVPLRGETRIFGVGISGRLKRLKRKQRFDDFTGRFLKRSEIRYDSLQHLREDPPEADLFIAGSDQIWNTFLKNGTDAAFYLDFVKSHSRKISYAASFATTKIFNNADQFVKEKLRNFDAISVRESSAVQLLDKLDYKDACLVCDPVFLLNSDSWLKITPQCIDAPENFILVYIWHVDM